MTPPTPTAPGPERRLGLQDRYPLDYYLIASEGGQPDGLAVEEFAYHDDHTAAGIDGAAWTRREGLWRSSAGFIRGMRSEPGLRGRVAPVTRREAEDGYRLLGGGDLPEEPELRGLFRDRLELDGGAPLQLSSPPAPEGCAERRTYRILFAGELAEDRLRELRDLWRPATPGDGGPAPARVLGTARRRVGDDLFTWDLRHIGPGLAWCLDVTACLGTVRADGGVGLLLRGLVVLMRGAGLIPVTVERFS